MQVFWNIAPYPFVNSDVWEERSTSILRAQKLTILKMVVVNSPKRL